MAIERCRYVESIVKEMGTRLAPGQTVVQEALALLSFVEKPCDIPGGESKGGHGKRIACSPTRWQPTRPPARCAWYTGQAYEGATIMSNLDSVVGLQASFHPFSPHIASAECKKGKALPPQRPLLGLVTASVLLGL